MLKMEDVTRIETYGSAYELLSELEVEFVESLDDERRYTLQHLGDYENITFCFMTDFNWKNQVVMACDGLCGDVIGKFQSMDEFKNAITEEIESYL